MSLVGTRPILQDELQKYELHHIARIAIKPGITGMWQVSGRSDITDFEEVVRLDGKPVNCYLKDVLVSPQNFAAVMCYKASLFRQYRTVNCIDIGDGTVDLLVIRKGQPDLSVRVSDRSGMAILRSEISNSIQQNYGIHLESSDVEQVLMQEATILDEEVVKEIQKMAGDWMQRIINKLHAYVPDFRTNPAVFLGGGSLLLKQQIEKSSDFKYIEFIEDIRANAVGYEKMTALHIQKRQGV